MKKFVLIIMMFLSVNLYAATNISNIISSAIIKSKTHSDFDLAKTTSALIYGGQDISRSQVATANESHWTTQHSLIG